MSKRERHWRTRSSCRYENGEMKSKYQVACMGRRVRKGREIEPRRTRRKARKHPTTRSAQGIGYARLDSAGPETGRTSEVRKTTCTNVFWFFLRVLSAFPACSP